MKRKPAIARGDCEPLSPDEEDERRRSLIERLRSFVQHEAEHKTAKLLLEYLSRGGKLDILMEYMAKGITSSGKLERMEANGIKKNLLFY